MSDRKILRAELPRINEAISNLQIAYEAMVQVQGMDANKIRYDLKVLREDCEDLLNDKCEELEPL
jgi:predicted transcriptional regulator